MQGGPYGLSFTSRTICASRAGRSVSEPATRGRYDNLSKVLDSGYLFNSIQTNLMSNPMTVIMALATNRMYSRSKQRMSVIYRNPAKTGRFGLVVCTVLTAVTFNNPVYGDDVDLPVGAGSRSFRQTKRVAGSKKPATATNHFVTQQAASIDTEVSMPKNSLKVSFGSEQGSPVPHLQSVRNQMDRGKNTINTDPSSNVQLRQVTGSEASRDTLAKLQQRKPSLFVSALNTGIPSKTSPYGNMHDTTGLRPYKPGVRYDRQDRHKSRPMFGGLFGRR